MDFLTVCLIKTRVMKTAGQDKGLITTQLKGLFLQVPINRDRGAEFPGHLVMKTTGGKVNRNEILPDLRPAKHIDDGDCLQVFKTLGQEHEDLHNSASNQSLSVPVVLFKLPDLPFPPAGVPLNRILPAPLVPEQWTAGVSY